MTVACSSLGGVTLNAVIIEARSKYQNSVPRRTIKSIVSGIPKKEIFFYFSYSVSFYSFNCPFVKGVPFSGSLPSCFI